MQVLKQFSLPIKGLEIGHHSYTFKIAKSFFEAFEFSLISDGNFKVELNLEKKSDSLILDLDINGSFLTDCDRCTDSIAFPLETLYQMIVKYDVDEREEEEVIFIAPEASEFNCAKVIYDAIILSVPLLKTCDEVTDKDCNPEVIDHFYSDKEVKEEKGNPFSEALKNLKLN